MSGFLNTVYAAVAEMPWYGWVGMFTIGCAAIVALAMRSSRRSP